MLSRYMYQQILVELSYYLQELLFLNQISICADSGVILMRYFFALLKTFLLLNLNYIHVCVIRASYSSSLPCHLQFTCSGFFFYLQLCIQDLTTRQKYLLTFTVGFDQWKNIDKAIKKVNNDFNLCYHLVIFSCYMYIIFNFLFLLVFWRFHYLALPLWWPHKWVGSVWVVKACHSYQFEEANKMVTAWVYSIMFSLAFSHSLLFSNDFLVVSAWVVNH